MRGTLRPERVKGKNMKKYSKIARIAAFALAVVMLFDEIKTYLILNHL